MKSIAHHIIVPFTFGTGGFRVLCMILRATQKLNFQKNQPQTQICSGKRLFFARMQEGKNVFELKWG